MKGSCISFAAPDFTQVCKLFRLPLSFGEHGQLQIVATYGKVLSFPQALKAITNCGCGFLNNYLLQARRASKDKRERKTTSSLRQLALPTER